MPGRFKPHRGQVGRLPPALRCFAPKLSALQVRDLGLAHIVNLDAISRGEADATILWQWAGGVLTWWRVAVLTERALADMQAQIDLVDSVVARFKRTGKVGFSGGEYQQAKHGVDVMDALASFIDRPTAERAADWAEAQLNTMVASVAAERKAA